VIWQLVHWRGSAESGPSFQAQAFAADTVAKSVFLFLSGLTWVLSDSALGVLFAGDVWFCWKRMILPLNFKQELLHLRSVIQNYFPLTCYYLIVQFDWLSLVFDSL
jgi:hypothetical protein